MTDTVVVFKKKNPCLSDILKYSQTEAYDSRIFFKKSEVGEWIAVRWNKVSQHIIVESG